MTADPLAALPHRWPMLLLDSATVESDEAVTAFRTVSAGDPWCGSEGLPPYLVLESWLQACATLLRTPAEVLVGGLRAVRATRAVRPGETIVHRGRVLRRLDAAALFTGTSSVGAETILTVEQATIAITAED